MDFTRAYSNILTDVFGAADVAFTLPLWKRMLAAQRKRSDVDELLEYFQMDMGKANDMIRDVHGLNWTTFLVLLCEVRQEMGQSRAQMERLLTWLEERPGLKDAVDQVVKEVVEAGATSHECYCVRVCSVVRGWMLKAENNLQNAPEAASIAQGPGGVVKMEPSDEADAEEDDEDDKAEEDEQQVEDDEDEEPWHERVKRTPMAPRGAGDAVMAKGRERALRLQQRGCTWRKCRQCLWARAVPLEGSRQEHCRSYGGGFKGPWRCGKQPSLAGWHRCDEIAEDAVDVHNQRVASALSTVKDSMQPPTDKRSKKRFLKAVRDKVCG